MTYSYNTDIYRESDKGVQKREASHVCYFLIRSMFEHSKFLLI